MTDEISNILPKVREYLKSQPIRKAWLFGSCSRGEEKPGSDVDILVEYESNTKITLFTVCDIRVALKDIFNRDIDLVEDGFLLPNAAHSAQLDRLLIYERRNLRPRTP